MLYKLSSLGYFNNIILLYLVEQCLVLPESLEPWKLSFLDSKEQSYAPHGIAATGLARRIDAIAALLSMPVCPLDNRHCPCGASRRVGFEGFADQSTTTAYISRWCGDGYREVRLFWCCLNFHTHINLVLGESIFKSTVGAVILFLSTIKEMCHKKSLCFT